MKRFTSFMVALCVLAGGMAMPAQAASTGVIGEAYSTVPYEEISTFDSAVMPEGIEETVPEEVEAFDLSTLDINEYEWAVLYMTNKIRMANGIAPLSVSEELQQAANVRKVELEQLMEHNRPNGAECFTVLAECNVPWEAAGENIAGGQVDPEEVISGWWNSEKHRENMMYSGFTHLAAGYSFNANSEYKHQWVQLFTGTCAPESISLVQDSSIPYFMSKDEIIDELGLVIRIECAHGTSYMPVTEEMCSAIDYNLIGQDQSVAISYGGKTAYVYIRVVEPMSFRDVNKGDWYYDYVATVYHNGIMTGLNETTFGPADNLARAQFAVILHRLSGEPEVGYKEKFPDIPDGQWYTEAVLWASDNGIVTGYTDSGLFGPGDNINREQMAVMMYRYAEKLGLDTSVRADYSRFSDAGAVNDFAKEAMSWAVGTGIISGKDNGTRLDPQGNANRAECAAILTRFIFIE